MVSLDYLVIGSGIAGLSFALKMAHKCPDRTVFIVSKADEDESNTKYAQGGVASVSDLGEDSYQKHISDTLIAGDGLCDAAIVEMVVKEGPERIRELMSWGVRFDTGKKWSVGIGS
ncbi:FAD-binding protein [Flagellimonas sp.]|uniref:FAD-binding protein n=1 Tax=Flagellimonas sp. TaxID=2058762 RepID=UPI003AB64716